MAIYIVQHGLSYTKEQDPDQGLNEDGKKDVKLIGGVARGYGVNVGIIWHSGKKRARETAEILEDILNPEQGLLEVSGVKPLDDVRQVADLLKTEDNVMIVSHMPYVQKLISYLVTGHDEHAVFKVQNGGIVCIDKDPDTNRKIIKWALMPSIS